MKGAVAYHVGFSGDQASPEVEKRIAALSTKDNDLRAKGRETYWVIRTRFSDSKLTGALIERSLGTKATFRNINTVRRLIAWYPPKHI